MDFAVSLTDTRVKKYALYGALLPGLLTLLLLLFTGLAAHAQVGQACINLTDIEVRELSNGAIVVFKADGALDWRMDTQEWVSQGIVKLDSYGNMDWNEIKPGHRFSWWIPNVRSNLNYGYLAIDKYPVSHLEISAGAPPSETWFTGEYALRITIETYTDISPFNFWDQAGSLDWTNGEDGQSQLVIFTSDRTVKNGLPPPEAAFDREVKSELAVQENAGLLEINALNVRLQELARELSRRTGRTISLAGGLERRITLSLHGQTLAQVLEFLERGYGLALGSDGDGYLLCEAAVAAAPSYASGENVLRPMHYLRAREARALLPRFLLPFIRADDHRNMLAISGPGPLVEHVLAQLEVVDQPGANVQVQALTVEFTSLQEAERALGLRFSIPGGQVDIDTASGSIGLLNLGGLPHEFQLRLNALQSASKAHIVAKTETVALSGEWAEVFLGQERSTIIEFQSGGYQQARVEQVKIGARLGIYPIALGGDEIYLYLEPEVSNLAEVEPRTQLPVVSTRRASATVRIKDGDTIAICGLRLAQENSSQGKIPLLGDLPLMGSLFRSRRADRRDSDMIVFVTARKLAATSEAAPPTARPGVLNETDPAHGLDLDGSAGGGPGPAGPGGPPVLQYHRDNHPAALQQRPDHH